MQRFLIAALLSVLMALSVPSQAATLRPVNAGHWRNRTGESWTTSLSNAEAAYGPFRGHWRNFHGPSNPPFNSAELAALKAGHRLFVNWKPSTTWAYAASGVMDSTLRSVAQSMEAACSQLSYGACWITFWHEPENDIGLAGSGMTAADYVAMWRHVGAIFQTYAPHVRRVWTMMGFEKWQPLYPSLWPGGTYVNVVGQDPYTSASAPPGSLATKMVSRLRWFQSTDNALHHWGPQSLPQAFPEYGCDFDGAATASYVADCLKAVQSALPTLQGLRLIELDYFDARGNKLGDPPSVDGIAYKGLKVATEAT